MISATCLPPLVFLFLFACAQIIELQLQSFAIDSVQTITAMQCNIATGVKRGYPCLAVYLTGERQEQEQELNSL